jgi:ankyrin repeat protein
MTKFLTFILLFLTSITFSQSLDFDLLTASYENDEKAIFDLLRRGADVNATTDNGTTPLMYAVQNGNYVICKKLISSGADVDASTTYGVPPLMNAVMNSDTGIVLLLLENNADPDAVHKSEMKSALIYSIATNNYFFSEILLHYGADPNKFVDDVSPLMQSIYLGVDTTFLNLLLDYGANPNLQNDKEYSPLMICVLYENIVATKLLLGKGAIPITKSSSSYFRSKNVLDYAIEYQLDEFIELYMPYFKDNMQYYHTKAILENNSSGAKKIREYSGKQFLSPILNSIIIAPTMMFNHTDIYGGMKVGFSEARYKFDFKFAVEPRLYRKAILVELRPNYFLQLWEKRTLLIVEIDKNFILKSYSEDTYGIYLRAKGIYSIGDYKGSNIEISKPYVFSPGIGIWRQHNQFKLSLGYSYLPIQEENPHYFGFGLNLLIPFHVNLN